MKIGDSVSVLDENLSGKISSVKGELVSFIDEHGFSHEFPQSKLVLRNAGIYDGVKPEKKFEFSKPVSKKHNRNHFTIDLHFEKLVENPDKYDSFERFFIQKEKLLEALDFCRTHRQKKMEIIHGIGDGTMQQLVIQTLEGMAGITFHHNAVLKHQSASIIVEFS